MDSAVIDTLNAVNKYMTPRVAVLALRIMTVDTEGFCANVLPDMMGSGGVEDAGIEVFTGNPDAMDLLYDMVRLCCREDIEVQRRNSRIEVVKDSDIEGASDNSCENTPRFSLENDDETTEE